ncbi:MAG: DUF4012 domain-containing protein [Akkermansiaceae bacterium]|nr:DUF4012 domain-containing protein [Akkermansiaceae bacterium]
MNIFARNRFDDSSDGLRRRLADLPPGVKWGAAVASLVALIFVGWLGLQGLTAKSNLEKARDSAEQAKDALLSGNSEDATRFAENAQFHARQAQAATHSVPWNIAAAVPLIGSPLKTTQQISDVVVGLADDVLLPGATLGAGLSPDKLINGTRINLKLLREEEPRLSELSTAAAKLDAQAQAISNPAYLSLIRNARSQLQGQTSRLAHLLGNTSMAAKLAPSMLGGDGPRTYLMGFQTPAEARGTGGLLGGFAVLRFDNGIPTVDSLVSNIELGVRCEEYVGDHCGIAAAARAEVDLGPEFNTVYGWAKPLTDYRNSNLSPHFPYAAQIWKSMWERRSGKTIDGVIALDPVALSYVLGAIGPVTLADGEVINADNVVELTMSTAYSRFADDDIARKKYLQDIAGAVVKKMAGPIQSPRKLIDAIGKAAGEGRISVWSALPADQKLLEGTPLAHVVPDDEAPFAQVIINNLAGNKMDYYLKREIEYAADGCDGDMRNSTITVRLTNTATDRPLPDNVAGTPGLDKEIPLDAPRGTMVSSVRVFTTKGAKLINVSSNGERTSAVTHLENGRPSFEVQVAIPPGQSGDLVFRLSEPTSPGEARVPVQPLVDNVKPKISVPACSG